MVHFIGSVPSKNKQSGVTKVLGRRLYTEPSASAVYRRHDHALLAVLGGITTRRRQKEYNKRQKAARASIGRNTRGFIRWCIGCEATTRTSCSWSAATILACLEHEPESPKQRFGQLQ